MKFIDCKIRLTQKKNGRIIEGVIAFELTFKQNGSEESVMPTETISLEEIQKVYEQIGITETTQQISQSTELDSASNHPVPTLYSQVSLIYSDSVAL